jgi:hypothetical protein
MESRNTYENGLRPENEGSVRKFFEDTPHILRVRTETCAHGRQETGSCVARSTQRSCRILASAARPPSPERVPASPFSKARIHPNVFG